MRDLSGVIADITPDLLSPEGLQRLARIDAAGLPKVPHAARLGVPLTGISKIVCVGLNYADHAAETGAANSQRTDPVSESLERAHRSQ